MTPHSILHSSFLIAALACACTDAAQPLSSEGDTVGGKSDDPGGGAVALRYASEYDSGNQWVAVIETQGRYFEEHIFVRYHDDSGSWQDREGRLLRGGTDSQLWLVDGLPAVDPLEFAIRHEVRFSGGMGREFWDNNGGNNYLAAPFEEPLGPGVSISASHLRAAALSGGNGYLLSLDLLVPDLAADKDVEIVYSFDNWQTTFSENASYQFGGAFGAERWRASAIFPAFATEIEVAAVARQNGQEAWDNNLGENFRCQRDPDASVWTCSGNTLVSCTPSGCEPLFDPN